MPDDENPALDTPESDSDGGNGVSQAPGPMVRMPPIDPSFDPYKVIAFAAAQPQWFVKPTTRMAANALFQKAAETIKIQNSAQALNNQIQLAKTKTFLQQDTQKKAAEILSVDTGALPAGVLSKFYPDSNGQAQSFNGDDVLAVNDAYKRVVVPTKNKNFAPVDVERLAEYHARLHSDPNADPTALALVDAEVARKTATPDGAAALKTSRVKNLTLKLDTANAQLASLQTDPSNATAAKAKQAEVDAISTQIDSLNGVKPTSFFGKVTAQAAQAETPSDSDISYLKLHPELSDKFNKRFGDGTASKYLPK